MPHHLVSVRLDARHPERDLPLDAAKMQHAVIVQITGEAHVDDVFAVAIYSPEVAVLYQAGTMSARGGGGGRANAAAFAQWLADRGVRPSLRCASDATYERFIETREFDVQALGPCDAEALKWMRVQFPAADGADERATGEVDEPRPRQW